KAGSARPPDGRQVGADGFGLPSRPFPETSGLLGFDSGERCSRGGSRIRCACRQGQYHHADPEDLLVAPVWHAGRPLWYSLDGELRRRSTGSIVIISAPTL